MVMQKMQPISSQPRAVHTPPRMIQMMFPKSLMGFPFLARRGRASTKTTLAYGLSI